MEGTAGSPQQPARYGSYAAEPRLSRNQGCGVASAVWRPTALLEMSGIPALRPECREVRGSVVLGSTSDRRRATDSLAQQTQLTLLPAAGIPGDASSAHPPRRSRFARRSCRVSVAPLVRRVVGDPDVSVRGALVGLSRDSTALLTIERDSAAAPVLHGDPRSPAASVLPAGRIGIPKACGTVLIRSLYSAREGIGVIGTLTPMADASGWHSDAVIRYG